MANNLDSERYTLQSFAAHLRSLPHGVLLATRSDGLVMGFYSGAVIGHDHAVEFRSWGVYHNLFIEHVRRALGRGAPLVDLGNTNDDFKRELGGRSRTVSFELRSGLCLRSVVGLGCWALGSLVPEDNFVRRAVARKDWRVLAPLLIIALLMLALMLWVGRQALRFRLLDLALLLGLCPLILSRLFGSGG